MIKKIVVCILVTFVLAGCSKQENPENVIALNDFEGLAGWGFTDAAVSRERAHSGNYAYRIDSNSPEYGISFNQVLGKVTLRKPKKIKVEGWVYMPMGANVTIVVAIHDTTDKNLLWQGFRPADEIRDFRQWTKISKEIKLPQNLSFDDKLSCYLWRTGPIDGAAFIDDLKVTVIE